MSRSDASREPSTDGAASRERMAPIAEDAEFHAVDPAQGRSPRVVLVDLVRAVPSVRTSFSRSVGRDGAGTEPVEVVEPPVPEVERRAPHHRRDTCPHELVALEHTCRIPAAASPWKGARGEPEASPILPKARVRSAACHLVAVA